MGREIKTQISRKVLTHPVNDHKKASNTLVQNLNAVDVTQNYREAFLGEDPIISALGFRVGSERNRKNPSRFSSFQPSGSSAVGCPLEFIAERLF